MIPDTELTAEHVFLIVAVGEIRAGITLERQSDESDSLAVLEIRDEIRATDAMLPLVRSQDFSTGFSGQSGLRSGCSCFHSTGDSSY